MLAFILKTSGGNQNRTTYALYNTSVSKINSITRTKYTRRTLCVEHAYLLENGDECIFDEHSGDILENSLKRAYTNKKDSVCTVHVYAPRSNLDPCSQFR